MTIAVFWFLVVLVLFAVWWLLRKFFVPVGKSFSDKRDEMIEIMHSNMYDEIIHDGCISEKTMDEFLKYYDENIKGK